MSPEADAQKDLALETEDAENVVGGRALKKKAKKRVVPHAGPNINIQTPVASTPYVDSSDCDPEADPGTMIQSAPADSGE